MSRNLGTSLEPIIYRLSSGSDARGIGGKQRYGICIHVHVYDNVDLREISARYKVEKGGKGGGGGGRGGERERERWRENESKERN